MTGHILSHIQTICAHSIFRTKVYNIVNLTIYYYYVKGGGKHSSVSKKPRLSVKVNYDYEVKVDTKK